MAVAGQSNACLAWSRELRYLFMAFSGHAGAGAALARTLEFALDEPAGVSHQSARDSGAGCYKLLLRRTAFHDLG